MSKTTASRAERSKLRESQILVAAKHCFSRVGFHSTSMAQIASQAQMSVGQIYRHFPSKESLIEGIVREDVARQLSLLNEASDQTVMEMVAPSNKKDIVDEWDDMEVESEEESEEEESEEEEEAEESEVEEEKPFLLIKNPWRQPTIWQKDREEDSTKSRCKSDLCSGTFWIPYQEVFKYFNWAYLNPRPSQKS